MDLANTYKYSRCKGFYFGYMYIMKDFLFCLSTKLNFEMQLSFM